MKNPSFIKDIHAREILSSGSKPTVETMVTLVGGVSAKASVPFGASDGSHEALILLDGDPKRFQGAGVLSAVKNVNTVIAKALKGVDASKQAEIDRVLCALDGTPNKKNLGANALLSVSLACARVAAFVAKKPLYEYIRSTYELPLKKYVLPRPLMVVLEGGEHADNSTDVQEYLIAPVGGKKVADCVRMGVEVYQVLKHILKENHLSTNVGNEGAYAPEGISSNAQPFVFIKQAIEKAAYKYDQDVRVGIDAAATEFFQNGSYIFSTEKKGYTASELIEVYRKWVQEYHLFLLEDGLAEDDWHHWTSMFQALSKDTRIVGDDLTVTSASRLQKALELSAINSIIIKPNQAGTLSETLDTVKIALEKDVQTIVSHRGGGETNDTFIIDLAVAINAAFVKVGPSRGERVEKYNRLMEIEEELG